MRNKSKKMLKGKVEYKFKSICSQSCLVPDKKGSNWIFIQYHRDFTLDKYVWQWGKKGKKKMHKCCRKKSVKIL